MPKMCFALFVKQLLALLTGILSICRICSRLLLLNLPGEARPPARNDRGPALPLGEQHVYLWRHSPFVVYGTAGRNHNMPELCFALFVKQVH